MGIGATVADGDEDEGEEVEADKPPRFNLVVCVREGPELDRRELSFLPPIPIAPIPGMFICRKSPVNI